MSSINSSRIHHFKNTIIYAPTNNRNCNRTSKKNCRTSKSNKSSESNKSSKTNKSETVKIILDNNKLEKFGYTDIQSLTKDKRTAALDKALQSGLKPVSVMRRLNALYIFNKNNNIKLASKFRQDMQYVRNSQAYKKRPSQTN